MTTRDGSRRPLTALMRTAEEARDLQLSWARPDLNFFSAGACHILAFVVLELSPHAGFRLRFIRPAPGYRGPHMYLTDGSVAFGAHGSVSEADLLRQHAGALGPLQPGWQAEALEVTGPPAARCAAWRHHAPDVPGDVWKRARRYAAGFPTPAHGRRGRTALSQA